MLADWFVPIIVALIGFAGIAFQARRIEQRVRTENTEQHNMGQAIVSNLVTATQANTTAIGAVAADVKTVRSEVRAIDAKVNDLGRRVH